MAIDQKDFLYNNGDTLPITQFRFPQLFRVSDLQFSFGTVYPQTYFGG